MESSLLFWQRYCRESINANVHDAPEVSIRTQSPLDPRETPSVQFLKAVVSPIVYHSVVCIPILDARHPAKGAFPFGTTSLHHITRTHGQQRVRSNRWRGTKCALTTTKRVASRRAAFFVMERSTNLVILRSATARAAHDSACSYLGDCAVDEAFVLQDDSVHDLCQASFGHRHFVHLCGQLQLSLVPSDS